MIGVGIGIGIGIGIVIGIVRGIGIDTETGIHGRRLFLVGF